MATQLELLEQFFFNRTDRIATQRSNGKPCPTSTDALDDLLRAHLSAEAPPVGIVLHYEEDGKPVQKQQRGKYRVGSYTPALDNTARWLCLDFDGPGHGGWPLERPLDAAKAT